MKVSDLKDITNYEAVVVVSQDDKIKAGYTGDLLSDVMANADSDSVLVTIQAHKNTVAVATLAGIKAIVICNKRKVPQDMAEAAEREGVAIYATYKDQFTVSAEINSHL